jgi:hypothetical protein
MFAGAGARMILLPPIFEAPEARAAQTVFGRRCLFEGARVLAEARALSVSE